MATLIKGGFVLLDVVVKDDEVEAVEEMPAQVKGQIVSMVPINVNGTTKQVLVAIGSVDSRPKTDSQPADRQTSQPDQESGSSRTVPPGRRW
jgi:hypothetical protein